MQSSLSLLIRKFNELCQRHLDGLAIITPGCVEQPGLDEHFAHSDQVGLDCEYDPACSPSLIVSLSTDGVLRFAWTEFIAAPSLKSLMR